MTGRACMGEMLTQVWLKSVKKWVSYLTNKWMHRKLPGFTQAEALTSPRKSVWWKWKKERRKNDVYKNGCEEFIRHLWKGRVIDIKELQVNNSWYNEGTICLVNGWQGDDFLSVGRRTGAIKLTMAGIQDWWYWLPPFCVTDSI